MQLSIVIPIYNSQNLIEKSLKILSKTLDAMRLEYEILLRDDGSQDQSCLILEKMETLYPHIHCFYNKQNFGLGYTLNTLLKDSTGKNVIYSDIDLPFSEKIFPAIMQEMESADLVIASRYIKGQNKIMLKRKITSRFYYYLCRVLFNVPVYDIGSGSVGIKRKVLDTIELQSQGFDFHIELIMKTSKEHFKIKEIPYSTSDIGQGTFGILRHGPKVFIDTIRFWRMFVKEEKVMEEKIA